MPQPTAMDGQSSPAQGSLSSCPQPRLGCSAGSGGRSRRAPAFLARQSAVLPLLAFFVMAMINTGAGLDSITVTTPPEAAAAASSASSAATTSSVGLVASAGLSALLCYDLPGLGWGEGQRRGSVFPPPAKAFGPCAIVTTPRAGASS